MGQKKNGGPECCSQLDQFCQLVEIRPGRKLNLCIIPGSVKIDVSASDCYTSPTPSPKSEKKNQSPEPKSFEMLSNDFKQKTTLFLFHGVGGGLKVWSPQIIYFNKLSFSIVAVDLIGHGLSSVPRDKNAYHFREMSEDALAIFDKYCSSTNVLMGHSYGCGFVAFMARRRAALHALVMIGGGGPYSLGATQTIFNMPLCILSCLRPMIFSGFMSRSFKRLDGVNHCQKVAVSVPMHVLRSTLQGQIWEESDAYYYSWITVPSLLIQGESDKLVPTEETTLMHQTIKESELAIIEDAGHMVMLESPDETNVIIWNFLAKTLSKLK